MNKFWVVAILSVAAAVPSFMPAQTTSRPETQLEAANKKALVSGDLEAAIRQYRNIVEKYKSNHAVAAEALLRMAQCFEKQGAAKIQEAQKAYERIVREYADQKEAAAEAQEHLATRVFEQNTGIDLRQVLSARDDRVYGRSVSRDGRYLSFALRGISLHDLLTRTAQVVIPAASNEDRFFYPMISPDGRQITFLRITPQGRTLQVVNTDGSNQHDLAQGAIPCGWSPDGRQVLALADAAKQNKLQLISAADSSSKTVAEGRIFCGQISPDGRQIAYEKLSTPASGIVGGIYLMNLDRDQEVPLSQDTNASNPLWTPEGNRVLFSRNRQEVVSSRSGNDLWSIKVADGKPAGPAELVRKDVPALLGVTQNGECYYQSGSATRDLYTIDIDPQTGNATSSPKQITSRYDNRGAAWSPDGQALAYFSVRTPNEMAVVIRSAKTGEERVFSPHVNLFYLGFKPEWFPDGSSLLLHYGNGKLAMLDVQKGEFRPLLESLTIPIVSQTMYPPSLVLAPDGSNIFYLKRDADTQQLSIVSRDLEGGPPKVICSVRADDIAGFSLSVDGSQLAFVARLGHQPAEQNLVIMTVAVQGGEPNEVCKAKGLLAREIIWSKDGQRLFFTSRVNNRTGAGGDILWVSAGGGEPQPLRIGLQDEYFLGMHPDGRQLIFMDENWRNELWVMKNLFSAAKSSR